MKSKDKNIIENIVNEVMLSKIALNKKMTILRLLDKAFRKHHGIIYLSNQELDDNDILFRSM